MLMLVLLLAAYAIPVAPPLPACRSDRLRLALDERDGDFNGMSHSGVALSIRNLGRECILPARPVIEFLDARRRLLPTLSRARPRLRPGNVAHALRLGGGRSAVADLRWVSGPVYADNRRLDVAYVGVRLGRTTLRAPFRAALYGAAGKPVAIEQAPLRAIAGRMTP